MTLNTDQGLFGLDFIDHHAILGISVDAEQKDIRKRYLKIARRLHPDSSGLKTDDERQRAGELLSKFVNPAYEYLSQEKNYTEYCVLLKLKGQQAQRQQDTIVLASDTARQLVTSANVDQTYQTCLSELAAKQYDSLDHTSDLTGQISELNLIYLMRKVDKGELSIGQNRGGSTATAQATSSTASQPAASPSRSSSPPPQSKDSLVESFVRRAEEYEKKQDFAKAILELREALRIKPSNANCHSRLGMIYLKTKQPKMARIHFNKALEIEPQNEIALAGQRSLQAAEAKSSGKQSKSKSKSGQSKGASSGRGGLFGLFGGKKK